MVSEENENMIEVNILWKMLISIIKAYIDWYSWPYGVMVSTLDFESKDPSSSLGRTSTNFLPFF